MRLAIIAVVLLHTLSARGVVQDMTKVDTNHSIDVTVDWSALAQQMMNNNQPEQQVEQVQMVEQNIAPVAVVQAPVMEEVQGPIFEQVNNGADVVIPNVNTVADLITRSWANIWSALSMDPNSSISLIYAAFKPLAGVDGVHWRLVFGLQGSGNVEYIALDVAVLANGLVDVFRNIQTRNISDISVLFGVSIDIGVSLQMQWLKESFFHNSPLVLNANYDAAQANITGFNIEWTRVQEVVVDQQQEASLVNIIDNLGGEMMPDSNIDMNADIGAGVGTDDYVIDG